MLEGEGLKTWRRLVLELDMSSDTAFHELFDKERLRLKQVIDIDIQDA